MKEFHVPCRRKQGREGITVYSYHGAMRCPVRMGECGAFAGFQQIRLLASGYQCLYGLLYCSYLHGVGHRVVVLADDLIHGEVLEFASLVNGNSRWRGRIVREVTFGTFISS